MSIKLNNLIVICLGILLLSGCWSSWSTSSSDSQDIYFSDYMMTINKGFLPIQSDQLTDHRLQGSLIAAYSIPRPTSDYFEKNIVIAQDVLWSFTLQRYVSDAIAGIAKTWWWYKQTDLTAHKVSCGTVEVPALQHDFTIVRGWLNETGQVIYFVQYFFAKGNKITILSSSTDNEDDIDSLHTYTESIHCATGTGDVVVSS